MSHSVTVYVTPKVLSNFATVTMERRGQVILQLFAGIERQPAFLLGLNGNAIRLAACQYPRPAQAPPPKSEVSRTCAAHGRLLTSLWKGMAVHECSEMSMTLIVGQQFTAWDVGPLPCGDDKALMPSLLTPPCAGPSAPVQLQLAPWGGL